MFFLKKISKKFFIVPYEDFESLETRQKAVKKFCKFLKIKFSIVNLKNTHNKKEVLPNSSFPKKVNLFEKTRVSSFAGYQFPKKKLPKQYFNFYKSLKNYFYK